MGGKRQGREKGKGGSEGGAWGGERKEGRGMEGISLPHDRLKTLAALMNTLRRTHANDRVGMVLTREKLAGDEIAPGILWVFRRST